MAFRYTKVCNCMISDEHVEYHIKLCNSYNIEQAYFDNTGMNLWDDIFKHLNRDAKMDTIVAILNEYYIQEVGKHAVPKLMSQICMQLKRSDRYFAEALCEYQSVVGKSRTQDFIHTYFNDIKRTQTYKSKYHDHDHDFDDDDM